MVNMASLDMADIWVDVSCQSFSEGFNMSKFYYIGQNMPWFALQLY